MASKGPEISDLTGIMVDANLQLADFLIVAPVVVPMLFGAFLLMLRSRTEIQGQIAVLGMGAAGICYFRPAATGFG